MLFNLPANYIAGKSSHNWLKVPVLLVLLSLTSIVPVYCSEPSSDKMQREQSMQTHNQLSVPDNWGFLNKSAPLHTPIGLVYATERYDPVHVLFATIVTFCALPLTSVFLVPFCLLSWLACGLCLREKRSISLVLSLQLKAIDYLIGAIVTYILMPLMMADNVNVVHFMLCFNCFAAIIVDSTRFHMAVAAKGYQVRVPKIVTFALMVVANLLSLALIYACFKELRQS